MATFRYDETETVADFVSARKFEQRLSLARASVLTVGNLIGTERRNTIEHDAATSRACCSRTANRGIGRVVPWTGYDFLRVDRLVAELRAVFRHPLQEGCFTIIVKPSPRFCGPCVNSCGVTSCGALTVVI